MTRVIHMVGEGKDLFFMKEDDNGKLDVGLWLCLNADSHDEEKMYVPGPPPPKDIGEHSFDEVATMYSILGFRVLEEGDAP